jgi:hypothetical protein
MRLALTHSNMTATNLDHDTSPDLEPPSLAQLVRMALDDAGKLVRAEVDLAKADLGKTLKLTAAFLIVVTASGVLLALTVSLLLAALVLSLHGTTAEALLAAAAGNGLISGLGILWLKQQVSKASAAAEEATPKPISGSEHGSQAA